MQILWTLGLALFLAISFIIARIFTSEKFIFKKYKIASEIILCVLVFIYLLAFRVNF